MRAAPDILLFLAGLLASCGFMKMVGPALQISDLPNHYKGKQKAVEKQSRFWRLPGETAVSHIATWNGIGAHFCHGPIDTTFAMRRRTTPFGNLQSPSYRTWAPYMASHVDWYDDSDNLPPGKLWYMRERANDTGGNW
jgi:hypothetical protein